MCVKIERFALLCVVSVIGATCLLHLSVRFATLRSRTLPTYIPAPAYVSVPSLPASPASPASSLALLPHPSTSTSVPTASRPLAATVLPPLHSST